MHTDGLIWPINCKLPSFNGYDLMVKNHYLWVAVYDKQRTIGVVAEKPPQTRARGFPTFSGNYPLILRWVRDKFYKELTLFTNPDEARRALRDPPAFIRMLKRQNRFKLPTGSVYWESTIWKESEMFPERRDPKSPLWNEWSDLKPGPIVTGGLASGSRTRLTKY